MRVQVTMRHGHVPEVVRDYVDRKLSRLSRRVDEETLVDIVLDREHNPKIADDHVVEADVRVKGHRLLAREAAPTFEAAVDLVLDKLDRQLDRVRDKASDRKRHGPGLKNLPFEPET
jgi:putative sigma-54 modulation protein